MRRFAVLLLSATLVFPVLASAAGNSASDARSETSAKASTSSNQSGALSSGAEYNKLSSKSGGHMGYDAADRDTTMDGTASDNSGLTRHRQAGTRRVGYTHH